MQKVEERKYSHGEGMGDEVRSAGNNNLTVNDADMRFKNLRGSPHSLLKVSAMRDDNPNTAVTTETQGPPTAAQPPQLHSDRNNSLASPLLAAPHTTPMTSPTPAPLVVEELEAKQEDAAPIDKKEQKRREKEAKKEQKRQEKETRKEEKRIRDKEIKELREALKVSKKDGGNGNTVTSLNLPSTEAPAVSSFTSTYANYTYSNMLGTCAAGGYYSAANTPEATHAAKRDPSVTLDDDSSLGLTTDSSSAHDHLSHPQPPPPATRSQSSSGDSATIADAKDAEDLITNTATRPASDAGREGPSDGGQARNKKSPSSPGLLDKFKAFVGLNQTMFTSAAASGKQQATQYSNKQVPLQQAAGAQNAAMAGGEGERFSGLRTSAKFQQQQQPAASIQAKKKNDFLLSFGGIQKGQIIPFNVASHFPSAASYFPSTLDSTRPLDCGREVETRFDPLKSRRLAVVEYDEVRQEEASHRHMEVLLARVHTLAEREQYRSHVYAKAQEIKAAQWKEMMMNNKNPSKELDVPLASFHVPRKNELVYPGAMARGFHNSSSKFKGYPTLNENIAVPASDELYLRFKPLADRRKKLASVDAIRTRDAYNRHAEAMIERQQQIKNNNAVHANKVAANRAKMDLQAMAVLDAESHRQMEDIQRHDALIAEKVAHVKEDRESHAQHAAENRKELQDMMRLLSGADSEKAFIHPAVITRGFPRTSALFADYPTYTKDESFTIPASDEKYMRFKPLLSHRKKLAAFDQRRHAEADDRRADLLKSRQQQLRFTREHRARKAAEARAAMAADDEERINAENQRQMADIERHDALIAERQAHLKEDTESHAQHAAENRADRAHNRELKLAAAGAGELESFGQKEEVHPAVIAAHFPHTSAAFAGCPSIVSDESVAVPLAEEQAHRFDCVHERRQQLAEVDDCRHADADERRAEMLESRQRLQDEDEMRGLLAAASRSSQNTMAVIDAVTQLEHNEQASINHGRFLKNRQERILHRESEHARHVQRLREAGWQGPIRGVDDKILLYGAPTNVAESGLVAPAYVASRFHHNSSYFNNHGSNNYMTEWIPVSEEEKLRFDALWARRQAIAPFEQDRVDAASEKHEGFLVDRQAALELKDYQWSQKVEAAHERREALYADAVVASRELEKMQSLGNGGEAVVASGGYSYDAIAPHSYMYEALDSHFPNSAARIRDRDDVCMEDQERHAAAEARHEADLKAKVFVLWSDHQRWAKRTSQMRQKPIQERKAAAKKSCEKLMTAEDRRAAILNARVKSLHEKDIQRRAKGTQALKDRQTAQMAFGQSTEQLECAKQQRMDLHKEEAEAHHLQQQQEQNTEELKQNEEEQPIMVDKIAPAAAEIVTSSAGGPSPAILPQEGEIEQQSSTPNAKNLKFDAAQHATSDDALQKDAENKNENVDLSENVEKSNNNNNNNSKDIAAAGGAPSVVDREVDDLVSAPAASNDRALPADKNANNGPKVDKSAVNIIPVHSSAFPPAGPSNTNNPKEKETKAKSRKMCCA